MNIVWLVMQHTVLKRQLLTCSLKAAMLSQGLEAEKKLLEASQQRSSAEAQENFKEKCRVTAELEALQKIQAAKYA